MIPIMDVTLFEDRGQILRRGRVPVAAGTTTHVIDGVAPVLVDKTLAARARGAEVVDVRVDRERIVRSEQVSELDEAVRIAGVEVVRLESLVDALRAQVAGLDRTSRLTLVEAAEDAGWNSLEPTRYAERLASLRGQVSDARTKLHDMQDDLVRRKLDLADLRRRLEASSSPTTRMRTWITLTLAAPEAGEAEIEVDYLVPCACWRPWHRAVLGSGEGGPGGRLSWECDACVWQNTGEDWPDVRLLVSTERASLGVQPPELYEDVLSARKVGKQVIVETRTQTIETASVGAGAAAPELGGIEDGGEPVRLEARVRASIPSDGRPYRAALFAFDASAATERIVMAQKEWAVILRSEQINEGAHPLLPGPVDLVRDSGIVGRSKVEYVAPKERFELGWGPDLALRVHREHRTERLESQLLSSWTGDQHDVEVRLSNIGPEPRSLSVKERIPVSEVEKVRVKHDAAATTGGVGPDADGFVRWQVDVRAHDTALVKLRYVVQKHADVQGV